MSRPPGVSVHVCALGMQVRTGPGPIASTSLPPLSPPLSGGVGGNKIQPFNLSSLLWLKSWPPFFFHYLFLFLWFFRSFFSLSHFSSFSVLKYDQKCGKLEGDAVLCPSQGDRGRETSDFCQAWGRRVLRVARPSQLPRARWARPVGFMQWDSQTPSFSEKKTFLPVTTE